MAVAGLGLSAGHSAVPFPPPHVLGCKATGSQPPSLGPAEGAPSPTWRQWVFRCGAVSCLGDVLEWSSLLADFSSMAAGSQFLANTPGRIEAVRPWLDPLAGSHP